MSYWYFPDEVWNSIKQWVFPKHQWVAFMDKSFSNHAHYLSLLLTSDPVTMFNIEYDTPGKRRFFREWLNIHANTLHPDFPTVGSIILDDTQYNSNAVHNWWGVYASHMGLSHAQNSSLCSNLLSHITVESALTSDLDKAESWLFYVTRHGIGYIGTRDINTIKNTVYNLAAQMRHGREWEMRMLRTVCVGSTNTLHIQYTFDQIMDTVVTDLLRNKFFESVEVIVESGTVKWDRIISILHSEYRMTRNPEILGIMCLVDSHMHKNTVYEHDDVNDNDIRDSDISDDETDNSYGEYMDTEDDIDTLWQHEIPFV